MAQTNVEHGVEGAERVQSPEGTEVRTSDGSITHRPNAQPTDKYTISEARAKAYGINLETEVPRWVRNPKFWEQHEGSDRVLEVEDACPGARVVRKANSHDCVTQQDLILMAVPRSFVEAQEAEENRAATQFGKYLTPNQYGTLTSHADLFDPADKEEIKFRAAMNSEAFRRAGMIGDPETAHLPLFNAERRKRAEDIEAEETRWRRGARHQEYDDEAWARMLDSSSPLSPRSVCGEKRFYGVGQGLGNANPNSALAQARRARERA